jgi:serine/tyrosine/threonine adenylyltransferase
MNPLLNLNYEPALESLGNDYYDDVVAADFPSHILRYRNDRVLTEELGIDPATVSDEDFVEAFGRFTGNPRPLLALRYHGYQFGHYNSQLGDGRGFLYGQVRGTDGILYDFGTKGSGKTPYSRGGDGMLTLKGGVREIIATETLARMGVNTSRCFSIVETGLSLWRGDEPSPTRSCAMVRFSKSHIRFGTFERFHYFGRPDLITKLLDYTIDYFYEHLRGLPEDEKYLSFYGELVARTARLAAEWVAAGFCHAVLNTDNMSITGESFDYGPFAFIPSYDPNFTAAYFDEYGRYSYGNQPGICELNLELLQKPLGLVMPVEEMQKSLEDFGKHYTKHYRYLMLRKLGLAADEREDIVDDRSNLLVTTIQLLAESQGGYHEFFADLTKNYHDRFQGDINGILTTIDGFDPALTKVGRYAEWQQIYHRVLSQLSPDELAAVGDSLMRCNPSVVPIRPVIESVWEPISQDDNWQPLTDLLASLRG